MEKYDFSGWATKNNLLCSDGRTIMKDAFKDNDGAVVPLVWNHQHNEPYNVLGHALLENRNDGVYAYCSFNDTESGQEAKKLVEHGDICSLSIYANKVKQSGNKVLHGLIREVSLVLAGANPGAFIDEVVEHSDEDGEGMIMCTGENVEMYHAEQNQNENAESTKKEDKSMAEEKSVKQIFDEMTDEQKKAVYAIVGVLMSEKDDSGEDNSDDKEDSNKEDEDNNMKHNAFEEQSDNVINENDETISQSDMEAVIADAKRYGSMKESAIQHGFDNIISHADTTKYGFSNVDYLFPDAKATQTVPGFIQRRQEWVAKVMNGVHRSMFSRIKSVFANITEEDARAKGYIKGNMKKDEFFTLIKRTTTPTTIYKKQRMDRDDVIDITDFDVIDWLKKEMRVMLDEEIARAILIGDGRLASSDDKIDETHIRPIANDDDLFAVKRVVDKKTAQDFIDDVIRSRKLYKGSGNPVLYTTEDVLTDMLLIKDTTGRSIYSSVDDLKKVLRVSDIVTVPVMEGATDANGNALLGILVNLDDYTVGADKGGAIGMFDDFDIDYNQMKYLIETRCSGALTTPYSAIVYSAMKKA